MTLTLPSPWSCGERGERRVPREARVLGERRPGPGGEREARPQLAVERVARRREQREGVGAAVEEDRDEHLLLRAGGGGGRDALVEHLGPERRAAVDGEREPDAARDERAPVETRSCRHRHAGLDRGQPAARLGEPAPQELRPSSARCSRPSTSLSRSGGRGRRRGAGARRWRRAADTTRPSSRSRPSASRGRTRAARRASRGGSSGCRAPRARP